MGIAVLPTAAENYTGDFLTNGVGGRALGLGGAYVSIADEMQPLPIGTPLASPVFPIIINSVSCMPRGVPD